MRRLGGFGRAALAAGLAALGVAAALSLWSQYRWLARSSETYPQAYRAALGGRLAAVAAEVSTALEADALRALDGPADAILPDAENDDVDRYFRGASAETADCYFLFSLTRDRELKISLYDPRHHPREEDWKRSYANVARNGSLSWIFWLVNRYPADPSQVAVFEANPLRLVITRPIVDASSRAIGVAGFVIHPNRMRTAAIPEALDMVVRRQPEGAFDGAQLAIVDADGAVVCAPGGAVVDARGAALASVPLDYPYPRWRLEASPVGATPEQEAASQFRWGMLQIGLAGALLVAGALMALRASTREMRALRLKADFVSNMTHELQSPLTSIKLHAELLRTRRLGAPDDVAECGTFIEREADRLSRLVNNVLDFGRIDAGRKTYRFREVQLEPIVEGVVEEMYPRMERADLYVDFEGEGDAAPAIADPVAVGQAIANVLDNAVKWSKSGDRIVIRCGSRPGWAWVSITDFGPGIASEEHARIFERFYRVETGLRRDVQGSGIGLALVKHVVDAHRGRVRVASEPGRGSTFTIELPAADPRHMSHDTVENREWEEPNGEAADRRG